VLTNAPATAEDSRWVMAESGRRFYRYADENGQVYLVDSLGAIPKAARSRAEVIVMTATPGANAESASQWAVVASDRREPREGSWLETVGSGFLASLDAPSVGMGAGLTIGLLALWKALGRFRGPALRFSFRLGVVSLAVGSYMAWLYRTGDLGDELLLSPKRLIEASRARVGQLQKQNQKRATVIEKATDGNL
jgi:hypothetical protein